MARLKLERLKEEYRLPNLDEELRYEYIENDKSLRDIARKLNLRITRQFLDDEPFESELVYQVFKEPDEVRKQTRIELKNRLQNRDIDIDSLRKDWVTHNPVRQYLNKSLDIDTSKQNRELSPGEALEKIDELVNYQESVLQRHLTKVQAFDKSKWELHTDLRLIDHGTGESVRLQEYFRDLQERGKTEPNSDSTE